MYDWKNVTLTCSGSEINDIIIIIEKKIDQAQIDGKLLYYEV